MDLSRSFSKINSGVSQKSQIFPTPAYFNAPVEGFPLELGNTRQPQETRMMGLSGQEKKVDNIFSHLGTIHELVGWTDRQTVRWDGRMDRQMDSMV